jgi:alpha-D-xyloside xylohydrolase
LSLIEDDGETYDFEKGNCNRVTLSWSKTGGGNVVREGPFPGRRYEIVRWDVIPPDGVNESPQPR